MINSSHLRRGLRNPHLVFVKSLRLLNRAYHRDLFRRSYNPDGIDVFDEEWDNLIILDACRYDSFVEQAEIPGRTSYRHSRGSTTREFVRGNFSGKTLYDTVYVSANGWFEYLASEIDSDVHSFIDLHTEEHREENGITTYPEVVTQKARSITDDFPNKRLIVHYLQPHSPFIGPFGQEQFETGGDIFEILRKSRCSTQQLRKAYSENLDIVLDEVEVLLEYLEGRTVITSDHGELLGDRSSPLPFIDYGHPDGTYIEELVKVPWHVVENGQRKHIIEEPPDKHPESTEEDHLEQHLRDLGYKV